MGKIILLNGPPSSGKDTAAKHIRTFVSIYDGDKWKIALDRMSLPIKRAFAGTMGLPISDEGTVLPYENHKEDLIPEFGISYRQWQIDFSEKFLKQYNACIFPELLCLRLRRLFSTGQANLVVIPDCGFEVEVHVLYENFPPEDILLIRCRRPGFDFSRDSRSYVRAPKGCAIFDPLNELLPEYLKQVEAGVRCWLETPERMPREE